MIITRGRKCFEITSEVRLDYDWREIPRRISHLQKQGCIPTDVSVSLKNNGRPDTVNISFLSDSTLIREKKFAGQEGFSFDNKLETLIEHYMMPKEIKEKLRAISRKLFNCQTELSELRHEINGNDKCDAEAIEESLDHIGYLLFTMTTPE